MAYQTTLSGHGITEVAQNVLSAVGGFFRTVGKALILNSSSTARLNKVAHLQAKTDEELAEMGLKREDIARYVFSDILYL